MRVNRINEYLPRNMARKFRLNHLSFSQNTDIRDAKRAKIAIELDVLLRMSGMALLLLSIAEVNLDSFPL